MLDSKLIDVINSCSAWAFVGSGCSFDAGAPLWNDLLDKIISDSKNAPLHQKDLEEINKFKEAQKLPEAFSKLKSILGSSTVDKMVADIYGNILKPGKITSIIANWPFSGYITTNYDHLLEIALKNYGGGWISIGNTADENRKISGNVNSVIWHPHGGAMLGGKNARFVIAKSDYDEVYSAGSPTLSALEAIFRMRAIIIIGFGFRDSDLTATMERVGRLITPSRPAFAFLANCDQKQRDEFWEKYTINVIDYSAPNGNHSELFKLLSLYGLYILERNMIFTGKSETPDYDTATVALLTHNRLIQSGYSARGDAQFCIARSFILAHLLSQSNLTIDNLNKMISHRSKINEAMSKTIQNLISEGLIDEKNGILQLTLKGSALANSGKATFELAKDQFKSSVVSRLSPIISDALQLENAVSVVISYIEKTCRERGLGVAQQLSESGDVENRTRAVALLQSSKNELWKSIDRGVALKAINCIWEIFTTPRPVESKCLGLMVQAYFGRHLLDIDPEAIKAENMCVRSTVFIADSNFLIPLLAEGTTGHKFAIGLAKRLKNVDCIIMTSTLLVEECVEHAQWAWKLLNDYGTSSAKVLDAARGARGYSPNAFLLGYLNHPQYGPGKSFKSYFAHILKSDGFQPDVPTMTKCLERLGIPMQGFSSWSGFKQELWTELEEVSKEIEKRRILHSSYKHDRQVKAEGEVSIIITGIRQHELSIAGHETKDAYFLSHSRVVDNLPGKARRVCMTPESLFEWLSSLNEVTDDDAKAIYEQLLWNFSREGIEIVPRAQLSRLFHNTINASRETLNSVQSEHREFIRERYTQNPETAFQDIDPLITPIMADVVSKDVLKKMQDNVAEEKKKRISAELKAQKAIKNSQEYERLKAEKRQRQEKEKKRRRKHHSSTKKKNKKKK